MEKALMMARNKRNKSRGKKRANLPGKPKTDIYTLYEKSVMSPDADVDFMMRIFTKNRGRKPRLFREDFCQTAYIACEWARRHSENEAWAIDLDPKPLSWARQYNLPMIGKAAERVHLLQEDVLKAKIPKVDIICGLNFSYFFMKKRYDLLNYFQSIYKGMKEDGIVFLDIMGGPDAQELTEGSTPHGYFTYVWDQDEFNPITNEITCYIHFNMKGGKKIKRAFTYDWRLWSVPEVKDVLVEAGFKEVLVYWEGEDKDGEGNGVYRLRKDPENTEAWVAYIVGLK